MSDFITVETPNGPVRFPKGMSRADMAAALNKLPKAAPAAPKSMGQNVKEFFLGDDDPNTQNMGEKIGSFLNKGGEAMTFGLIGDETSAAVESMLPGVDYEDRRDHYRTQEEVLERDNPGAALAAEIGGAVVGALTPMGKIGTLGKGVGLGPRIAASAAAGAGMGGTYGAMEGEDLNSRLKGLETGAKWGAAGGAIAPVVASGVSKVADALVQRGPIKRALATAKTAAEQRAGSRAQYKIFGDADAGFNADAMTRLKNNIGGAIDEMGAPKIPGALGAMPKSGRKIMSTFNAMDDEVRAAMAQPGTSNAAIPLSAVEDARKAVGVLGREVDNIGRPTHGAAIAQRATQEIDEFINNLDPADMVTGDANAAVAALKKARDMWKTARKTQMVENAIDQSDIYLSGQESGLRNQIKSLLRRNAKENLFNDAEVNALKKIIGGSVLSRTIRTVGDGLGRKAALFTGGALGGIEGAAIGAAAGEAASAIGGAAAMRKAEIARALIASGALQNLPNAPDIVRKITEALTRQIGAVAPQ
jgi:hypothetical protein